MVYLLWQVHLLFVIAIRDIGQDTIMKRLMTLLALCAVVGTGLVGCGDKGEQKAVNPAAPANGQQPLKRKITSAGGAAAPVNAQAKMNTPN